MVLPEKFRALAASARIANIPSVISNVWLGIALRLFTGTSAATEGFWQTSASLCFSGIFLYLAGNFLNDWTDRDWDAVHRPERALPRGLFQPAAFLVAAIACGVAGIGAAALAHPRALAVALGIGFCVGLYTWSHKRGAWSVIPMGLCRALLPVLGFSGFLAAGDVTDSPWPLALAATGVFYHVAGLSIRARGESATARPRGNQTLAVLLFSAAAMSMLWVSLTALKASAQLATAGVIPYLAWLALAYTVFRQPMCAHVSSLLAGIPFVDWIVLLPLSNHLPAPLSTVCLWLPPLAFLAARCLQRVAPAT